MGNVVFCFWLLPSACRVGRRRRVAARSARVVQYHVQLSSRTTLYSPKIKPYYSPQHLTLQGCAIPIGTQTFCAARTPVAASW
eukprot:7323789-Prymnesium_polylepis.2